MVGVGEVAIFAERITSMDDLEIEILIVELHILRAQHGIANAGAFHTENLKVKDDFW